MAAEIISTIESTKELIREIFNAAQMIRALHDDLYEDTRDVDILYGLLLHANAAAVSTPTSVPIDHRVIASIATTALSFAYGKISQVLAARAILQTLATTTKNDPLFSDAFREAIANAKTCITKDAIEFARGCESFSYSISAIASAVERKSRVTDHPCEYDARIFEDAYDSATKSCFASVMANYPEDARISLNVFAKFIDDASRESMFHLIKSAHEILAVMGDGRRLIEFIKIAVQHERAQRAIA